jgi:hypothetical protein
MRLQTLDDYLTRFGEQIGDFVLTGSADGERVTQAKAASFIHKARVGLFRQLLGDGIVESRFATRTQLSPDASDTDFYPLPPRAQRLISVTDADDIEYHSVFSRSRISSDESGYLVVPGGIRWFNVDPPTTNPYANYIQEPVRMTRGTPKAAYSKTAFILADTPAIGANVGDNDYYNGAKLKIVAGTGVTEESDISDHDATTNTVTVSLTTTPDATSRYCIADDMPLETAPVMILRAVLNFMRFDASMESTRQLFYGEYKQAYSDLLIKMKTPASSSATGPRKSEDWRH